MNAIYPSLINGDLLDLKKDIVELDPHCNGYHLDIMDNHFVPNLTWGHAFVNAIADTSMHDSMWVHLMVTNPGSFLNRLTLGPNSIVSFHIEAEQDIIRLINDIKLKGWRPSIALKPSTPIEEVFPFLSLVDHVLIMAVEPGFSGQMFIQHTFEKIDILTEYCKESSQTCIIGVDGGVTQHNCTELMEHGVTDFAIASAIFNQKKAPIQELKKFNTLIKEA